MGPLGTVILALSLCGGGETVLLDFYSDACPPCRAMDPVVRQLATKGYPIRKVNVQHEPGLASRFGVRGIPCFVMLVDGREVDRVVGATQSGRLEQMLALARPPAGAGHAPAGPAGTWAAGGDPSPRAVAIPAELSNSTFSATPSTSPLHAIGSQGAVAPGPREHVAPAGADQGQLEADLISYTVRLRIEDASGHSCGSGTLVDARGQEALILTCGHLFRDSQGKGRIRVDLFGVNAAEDVPGELVHYDLEKDLALLKIRPAGPVRTARIASPGYRIAKGARVVNVGCNNGDPPTIRYAHVTALDKFLGPANVEVSGLPVQGRSGGGLFTTDGLVIGVCNAAVPDNNEGLYAALASIHAELDHTELAFVYHQPAHTAGSADPRQTPIGEANQATMGDSRPTREPGPSAIAGGGPPFMPKTMPPPADLVRLTEAPGPPAPPPSAAPADNSPPLSPEEQATLEEIQRRKAEGAEVICIIRSRTDPLRRSEVIVLDRVSPAFLKQLTTDPPTGPADAQRPRADNTAVPAPPPQPAGAPISQTTDANVLLATPASEWRPRWLELGYQGS